MISAMTKGKFLGMAEITRMLIANTQNNFSLLLSLQRLLAAGLRIFHYFAVCSE